MQQTKKLTQSDIIIAVMSGPFLQRGEPALISKWYRTKMALANGVDLVVELPYVFATQKAETFANGAISILNALRARMRYRSGGRWTAPVTVRSPFGGGVQLSCKAFFRT